MTDSVVALQFEQIADDLIDQVQRVGCIDSDHLRGIRYIRDRINKHLAELHDHERSGVTQ